VLRQPCQVLSLSFNENDKIGIDSKTHQRIELGMLQLP